MQHPQRVAFRVLVVMVEREIFEIPFGPVTSDFFKKQARKIVKESRVLQVEIDFFVGRVEKRMVHHQRWLKAPATRNLEVLDFDPTAVPKRLEVQSLIQSIKPHIPNSDRSLGVVAGYNDPFAGLFPKQGANHHRAARLRLNHQGTLHPNRSLRH